MVSSDDDDELLENISGVMTVSSVEDDVPPLDPTSTSTPLQTSARQQQQQHQTNAPQKTRSTVSVC